jgi:hypothetical protein
MASPCAHAAGILHRALGRRHAGDRHDALRRTPRWQRLGLPSGLRKQLVERFSLTEDRRHLKYEFVLEDPEWFTAPVKQSIQWDYQPDLKPSGARCDIAAASRFLK